MHIISNIMISLRLKIGFTKCQLKHNSIVWTISQKCWYSIQSFWSSQRCKTVTVGWLLLTKGINHVKRFYDLGWHNGALVFSFTCIFLSWLSCMIYPKIAKSKIKGCKTKSPFNVTIHFIYHVSIYTSRSIVKELFILFVCVL